MDLQQVLRYDDWANREALATLNRGNAPSQAIGILAHIIAVNRLWLSRAVGEPCPESMWPVWPLTTISAEMRSCFTRWETRLRAGHIDRECDRVDYNNSKGEQCSNNLEELMLELLCHSARHRGQIALLLRQNGSVPAASTDFIPALRARCF